MTRTVSVKSCSCALLRVLKLQSIFFANMKILISRIQTNKFCFSNDFVMDQRAVQQLLLQQLQSTGASEEAQAVPQPELNNLALQARHWAVAQQRKQEYDEQQRQQQAQWEAQKQRQGNQVLRVE